MTKLFAALLIMLARASYIQ